MKRLTALAIAAVMVCTSSISEAAITRFDVSPSYAPNAFGSPSWGGYVSNAHTGLMGDPAVNVDDRTTDPTAFELVDPAHPSAPETLVDPKEMIVTTFNSWRGDAPPVGAAFAGEFGNRVQFGFSLETSGGGIDISTLGITWEKKWMNNDAAMDVSSIIQDPVTTGTFSTDAYTDETIGVRYNPDGTISEILTSGIGVVDAIYSVGVGDGLLPDDVVGATDQEEIDLFLSGFLSGDHPAQKLTTTYTITLDSNEELMRASTVFLIPEPGSLITMLPGLGFLAALMRRRRT